MYQHVCMKFSDLALVPTTSPSEAQAVIQRKAKEGYMVYDYYTCGNLPYGESILCQLLESGFALYEPDVDCDGNVIIPNTAIEFLQKGVLEIFSQEGYGSLGKAFDMWACNYEGDQVKYIDWDKPFTLLQALGIAWGRCMTYGCYPSVLCLTPHKKSIWDVCAAFAIEYNKVTLYVGDGCSDLAHVRIRCGIRNNRISHTKITNSLDKVIVPPEG